ncbi:transposase [Streptomyces sp. NPDC056254]|uniref:transposase n=1 Tax=Streptomyces sp. NPDC056254 TaxID=3345763 RepID=UPI0035DC6614
MPERYGPRARVYDLFRRWQRDGTWARILTQLQAEADSKGLITWDVNVDSTVCRAHQHAAEAARGGPAKEPPGGIPVEPATHGLGHSRGGLTSKIHLAVEQGQKPLSVVITAGQRGDSPQFEPVLEAIRVPQVERKAHRYLVFNGDCRRHTFTTP